MYYVFLSFLFKIHFYEYLQHVWQAQHGQSIVFAQRPDQQMAQSLAQHGQPLVV